MTDAERIAELEEHISELEKALVAAALIVHTLTTGIMPTKQEREKLRAEAAQWTMLVQGITL